MPNNDLTNFIFGMDFIVENKGQRIFENCNDFIKTDTVLSYVCSCFI